MKLDPFLATQCQEALSLLNQATQFELRGQPSEAVELLQRAMSVYPYLPSQRGRIARLLEKMDQPIKAIEAAGNELLIRPDNTDALTLIGAHQSHLPRAQFGAESATIFRIINELCEAVNRQVNLSS